MHQLPPNLSKEMVGSKLPNARDTLHVKHATLRTILGHGEIVGVLQVLPIITPADQAEEPNEWGDASIHVCGIH